MPELNVLLVDDDSDETYLFKEALEHANLKIKLSRAVDGNDLIRYLQHDPLPDLVFIDINMPYKDGIEALSEIRAKRQFDKLALVIYSTSKNDATVDECYERGANLFVVKPDNFDKLVNVIRNVLTLDWTTAVRPSREDFVVVVEN